MNHPNKDTSIIINEKAKQLLDIDRWYGIQMYWAYLYRMSCQNELGQSSGSCIVEMLGTTINIDFNFEHSKYSDVDIVHNITVKSMDKKINIYSDTLSSDTGTVDVTGENLKIPSPWDMRIKNKTGTTTSIMNKKGYDKDPLNMQQRFFMIVAVTLIENISPTKPPSLEDRITLVTNNKRIQFSYENEEFVKAFKDLVKHNKKAMIRQQVGVFYKSLDQLFYPTFKFDCNEL